MDEIAYIFGVVMEVLKGNLAAEDALVFLKEYLSQF